MTNDPVLIAYAARRGNGRKVQYARIGRAYPHDSGVTSGVNFTEFQRIEFRGDLATVP